MHPARSSLGMPRAGRNRAESARAPRFTDKALNGQSAQPAKPLATDVAPPSDPAHPHIRTSAHPHIRTSAHPHIRAEPIFVACEPLLLGGRIDGDVAGGKVRFMHDVVPTSSLLVPSTLTPAGRWLLSVVALAALSACSSLRGPTTAPPPPLLGAPTSTPSPPPSSVPAAPSAIPLGAPSAVSPGTPAAPAFDSVIKGADVQAGLMPVWRRQDKVWIELAPTDFGRALFLSPKLVTGVGESGLLGGLLGSRWAQVGRPQWVEFRRVHNQVQLVARNAAYRATPDTPQAQAVSAAFSPSLLASVPVASAPHPQRQTVLVELSALMTGDLLGLGAQLQRAYRQSYSLDARNTQIQQTQGTPGAMVVQVQQHFATASLASRL